jgi:hypothetical protein
LHWNSWEWILEILAGERDGVSSFSGQPSAISRQEMRIAATLHLCSKVEPIFLMADG